MPPHDDAPETPPDDDAENHERDEVAHGDAVTHGDEVSPEDEVPRDELPQSVVDAAERLTRLAGEAVDEDERAAYLVDRDETLAEYDFTARVRDDAGDAGETLVLHPVEWVADGTIRPERIDDTDRAVEVSLSGPADPERWEDVEDRNRAIVEQVREAYGDVHAANVRVLADFAGNHYAKPIPELTASELREFASEYVPRNAWLTDAQAAVLEESVRYAFEAAKERMPDW